MNIAPHATRPRCSTAKRAAIGGPTREASGPIVDSANARCWDFGHNCGVRTLRNRSPNDVLADSIDQMLVTC